MDGRFAPSPTGPLHLGSLRTALAAWLFARGAGSRFVVRVEDLDPARSRREWESRQLADLAALGIDHDGPVIRQSERFAEYERALERLGADGRTYPCFCTRAEIRAAASAPHGDIAQADPPPGDVPQGDPAHDPAHGDPPQGGPAHDPAHGDPPQGAPGEGAPKGTPPRGDLPDGAYPGTCRGLDPAVAAARIAAGDPHALRVDARSARIAFDDGLLGPTEGVVDDFVVRRADGVPAYQLAVVVDDAAQGIEQVVRGADLADSTPRQILLARWLDLPVPAHAHLGLVLGADGVRLAKRHGGATLADRGRLGEPLPVTLAWLAHSLGLATDRDRVRRSADLLEEFDPAALPRGPVILTADAE